MIIWPEQQKDKDRDKGNDKDSSYANTITLDNIWRIWQFWQLLAIVAINHQFWTILTLVTNITIFDNLSFDIDTEWAVKYDMKYEGWGHALI